MIRIPSASSPVVSRTVLPQSAAFSKSVGTISVVNARLPSADTARGSIGRRLGLPTCRLRERRHRRAHQRQLLVGERVQRLGVVGDLLPVGLGEAAVALVDDQPLRGLPAWELLVEDLDDLGRLGALGQERGRVVLGLVGELRAQGRQRREGDDPEDHDDELAAPTGDERG